MAESAIKGGIIEGTEKTITSSDGKFKITYREVTYNHVNTIYGLLTPLGTTDVSYSSSVVIDLNHLPIDYCVAIPRCTVSVADRSPKCTIQLIYDNNGTQFLIWGAITAGRDGQFNFTYVF